MRDWSVSHGNDGFSIRLIEVPVWARAFTLTVNYACVATRHVLCGGGTPEFFWNIPVGRPRRDEDGYLENSVGGALYHLFNKLVGIEWRREKVLYTTSVPDEVGKDLWGPTLRYWEDDEEE